jgi:hypothetical protein
MRAVVLLLLTLLSLPVLGDERITMRVSPNVSFAPARILVRATIERSEDNRALQVVADSPDYYRSTTLHLDGQSAARLNEVRFRNLPVGSYRITVNLLGVGDEVLATANQALIVNEPRVVIDR